MSKMMLFSGVESFKNAANGNGKINARDLGVKVNLEQRPVSCHPRDSDILRTESQRKENASEGIDSPAYDVRGCLEGFRSPTHGEKSLRKKQEDRKENGKQRRKIKRITRIFEMKRKKVKRS